MDFIFDNLIIIIIAASGLVQWWETTQEAKKERENQRQSDSPIPRESGELMEKVERRLRPAVPPTLPRGANPAPPSFDRSPAPMLKKVKTVVSGSIRDRLKNRSELRQAFVMAEFLEKPVGLR